MENERQPQFTIEEMHLADVDEATKMRLESWLDTYVNEELGVTREWIEERNAQQSSAEASEARKKRFQEKLENETSAGWVARDASGKIVGATTPYVDEDGVQHVGSLYVDKNMHGTGVGSALMQKVVDWFDPKMPIELGVVMYNERAKAFYRKWGFEEVLGSETLFADTIPEVKMIRKAISKEKDE